MFLFTDNQSIGSHFPPMDLSVTGGEITSMSAALIHMSHVRFVLRRTISTVNRMRKWERVKIEHKAKISPLHVSLHSLI